MLKCSDGTEVYHCCPRVGRLASERFITGQDLGSTALLESIVLIFTSAKIFSYMNLVLIKFEKTDLCVQETYILSRMSVYEFTVRKEESHTWECFLA